MNESCIALPSLEKFSGSDASGVNSKINVSINFSAKTFTPTLPGYHERNSRLKLELESDREAEQILNQKTFHKSAIDRKKLG